MATTKQCTRCREVKPVSEFRVLQRKKQTSLDSWCYGCYSEVEKDRKRKRLSAGKKCTKCKTEKPLFEFPPAKLMADGRGSWCRDCVAVFTAEWRAKRRESPKIHIDGKECGKCGFYKHRGMFGPQPTQMDGLHTWCKQCVTEGAQERRATDEGRENTNASTRRYNKTDRGKAVRKAYRETLEYCLRDAARKMVIFAVKAGVIERPSVCELSGQFGVECKGRIEGHHHLGYDVRNWLDVIWCCQTHHRMVEHTEEPHGAVRQSEGGRSVLHSDPEGSVVERV